MWSFGIDIMVAYISYSVISLQLVTGSNSTFGLSSDCREWTQVEP